MHMKFSNATLLANSCTFDSILYILVTEIDETRTDISENKYIYHHQARQQIEEPVEMTEVQVSGDPLLLRIGVD